MTGSFLVMKYRTALAGVRAAWVLPGLVCAPVGIDKSLKAGILGHAETRAQAYIRVIFIQGATTTDFGVGIARCVRGIGRGTIETVTLLLRCGGHERQRRQYQRNSPHLEVQLR